MWLRPIVSICSFFAKWSNFSVFVKISFGKCCVARYLGTDVAICWRRCFFVASFLSQGVYCTTVPDYFVGGGEILEWSFGRQRGPPSNGITIVGRLPYNILISSFIGSKCFNCCLIRFAACYWAHLTLAYFSSNSTLPFFTRGATDIETFFISSEWTFAL